MSYLLENELLSNRHNGFIKGRLTMLQLLHMFGKWIEYSEGGSQIDAIYSEFEKAFDKVPHRRLISRLYSHGLHDSIINWSS